MLQPFKVIGIRPLAPVQNIVSLNPNLYGGGGKFAPQAVLCYSSKTVGARLLRLRDFYC